MNAIVDRRTLRPDGEEITTRVSKTRRRRRIDARSNGSVFVDNAKTPVGHRNSWANSLEAAEAAGNESLACVYRDAVYVVTALLNERDAKDITIRKLKSDNKKLMAFAASDKLTGIGNRLSYDLSLQQAEETGKPFSLIMIDLDGIKAMNDTLGHPFVDDILRLFAFAFKQCVRESDIPSRIKGSRKHMRPNGPRGRLGGDEFAAVLQGCSLEDAYHNAELLRCVIAEISELLRLPLGASIGVVYSEGNLPKTLVHHIGDQALYVAKSGQTIDKNAVISDNTGLERKKRVCTANMEINNGSQEAVVEKITYAVHPHLNKTHNGASGKRKVNNIVQQALGFIKRTSPILKAHLGEVQTGDFSFEQLVRTKALAKVPEWVRETRPRRDVLCDALCL